MSSFTAQKLGGHRVIRTLTVRILSPFPLPVGIHGRLDNVVYFF